jgi:hypothetical protein
MAEPTITRDENDEIVRVEYPPKSPEEMAEHYRELDNQEAKANRAKAYIAEADALFFKSQRGEATLEEWQAKVEEIKARFPYR